MIGYPGLDHVVTGGRGVLRTRMHVHGVAGHSGASKTAPSAIAKAAALITRLHDIPLPGPSGPELSAAGQADRHRDPRRRGVFDGPGPVHVQRRCPADPRPR